MNSKEWKKWLFWFTFAVACIAVYKTVDSVTEIFAVISEFLSMLTPFLMAVLVAYILYIPCRGVENWLKSAKIKLIKNHARGLSVLIVYTITVLLIFLSIKFIMPSVSESVTDLANNIPNYYNNAINYLNNVEKDSLLYKLNIKEYISSLQEIRLEKEIVKWINFENISSYIQGIVGATNAIFDIFVTFVVSIYMLLERSDIKSFLYNLSKVMFDKKTNATIAKYYNKTNSIFFSSAKAFFVLIIASNATFPVSIVSPSMSLSLISSIY